MNVAIELGNCDCIDVIGQARLERLSPDLFATRHRRRLQVRRDHPLQLGSKIIVA